MPEIPKGATVPADHQKPAAQLEAEKAETTAVVWRGHTFTVATDPDDYPIAVVMAFENGRNLTGLEILLGAKQWTELAKTMKTKRDATDLLEVMGEALGLGD
jgi:hypothetical protein